MSTWNPKANEIFLHALERSSSAERREYIDVACAGDESLRADVEALLAAGDEAGSFLQSNAAVRDLAATVERPEVERLGILIGRYKLLEQIGEGGFGIVFMAEQQEPVRRKVALKVLKPGMDTRQVVARFEAERQALALMDHPNIAHVFDGGTTAAGRPYFVMDLVKGVPITEYCDQNQIAPRERLELFVQVCEAVQHAHQKGIIHRDIKPSNVLISRHDGTPVVKVIDFGIAKAQGQQLTEKTLFTNFAQLIGTPLYMSPEQAGMSDLDVDTRSDIYSLGVLLYELLTGSTPFDAQRFKEAGFDEMRRIIREEEPPKPSTRVSTVGRAIETVSANRKSDPKQLSRLFRGELDWIVMKALEKDRDRRYETANGLAMDVKRYLCDEPVLACPPSVAYRLRKFARRNQAILTTLALVTAALLTTVVVLVISNLSISREEKEKSDALIAKNAALKQAEANLKLILTALDEVYIAEAEKRLAAYQTEPNKPVELQDPRQLQVERDFLQKGMSFYEKLIQPGNAEPTARFQTAKAFRRVGILQWELKQYDKAAESLAKAVSLLLQLTEESPTEPQHRSELAEAYRWQGRLWGFTEEARGPKEAKKAYRQAIALADRLVGEFPTNRDYRMRAATYHMELGTMIRPLGRHVDSEKEYQQAVKLWRKLAADFPSERWYRHELAFTLDGLGKLWQESASQSEKAVPFFHEALGLHAKLVAEDPTVENRARLASSQQRLAEVLTSAGRLSQGEEALRASADALEKLAVEFPENASYQSTLQRSYDALEQILTSAGKEQDAQEIYQRAIKNYQTVVAADPRHAGSRDRLARNQYNLAGLLRKAGRRKEAAKSYREASAIWEKLASDFPARVEYSQHWAYSVGRQAVVLNEDGQPEEAIAAWHQQISLSEAIVARSPESVDTREQLRHAYHSLAIAQRSRGRHEEAVAAFAQAAAVTEKLASELPGNAWYFDRLHDVHSELASTFIRAARCEEGERFYSKAIELKPNDAMLWFRRAEFHARLGLWDLAAKDSSAAFKLQPLPTSLQCFAHALLGVQAGDLDSYWRLCELMPNRFPLGIDYGTNQNTLPRACTITKSAQANAVAWALERAKMAWQRAAVAPWDEYALGLAYCRSGNFKQAVQHLERSVAAGTAWAESGLAYPALALAHHHLGQGKNAEAALRQADLAIDRGLDVLAQGPADRLPASWWEDWLEPILLYREAKTLIDGAPPVEDPRVFVARARAFAALGDEQQASESYANAAEQVTIQEKRVAELDHEDGLRQLARMHEVLGELAHTTGRLDDATTAYGRAAEVWRKLVDDFPISDYSDHYCHSVLALASVHAKQERFQEAEQALTACAENRPDRAAGWRLRGEQFARWGLFPEAAADFARAYELEEPRESLAWVTHALLRVCVGDTLGYQDACRRILVRFADSTNPEDWNHVAQMHTIMPDSQVEPSRAVALAERAVAAEKHPWRLAYLGLAYFRDRDFQRSAAALEESLAIDANWNSPWVYSALAMAWHQLGRSEQAAAALAKAARARDQRLDDMLARGVGDWPGLWFDGAYADLLFREAIALVHGSPLPEDPRWLALRSRSLEAIGRAGEAQAAWVEAFSLAPNSLMIRVTSLPDISREDAYAKRFAEVSAFAKEHPQQPPAALLALAQAQQRYGDRQHKSLEWNAAATALLDAAASYENLLARIAAQPKLAMPSGVPATAKEIAWYRHELGFVLTYAGEALRNVGRLREADGALARGLQIHQSLAKCAEAPADTNARLAWTHAALGTVFQARGSLREAEQKYREAIALLEGQSKADYWLGGSYDALAEVYELDGRMAEAIGAQRKAVAAWEQHASEAGNTIGRTRQAWTLERLAVLLLRTQENAAAAEAYNKAVAIFDLLTREQPHRADLNLSAALLRCRFAMGLASAGDADKAGLEFRKAIADYGKAIEVVPDSALAHNKLGWLYATCPAVDLRDPARAVALAKKAVELKPADGAGWNTLGAAQYRAGDWQAAIDALSKSMELRKGGDAFDWFFLAMARWRQGDKDEALKLHAQAIEWTAKNQPNDEELNRFRAEAADLIGKKEP